jgi:hypothetical protein
MARLSCILNSFALSYYENSSRSLFCKILTQDMVQVRNLLIHFAVLLAFVSKQATFVLAYLKRLRVNPVQRVPKSAFSFVPWNFAFSL